jgi:hypothetical protein
MGNALLSDDLMATIAAALESAGISGLCRDGCLEFAVDRLRKARPDLDSFSAWALVRLVDETLGENGDGE